MNPQAFGVFIQDVRDGRAHAELSVQLAELIAAVRNTGKSGSLTLKIDVKPAGKGSDVDKVVIADTVTAKVPKPERGQDFYWLTDSNHLSRNHPRQQDLPLRDASKPAPTTFKEAAQ